MTIEIKHENQGARITENAGGFYSLHVVNARKGFDHPDAVVVGGKSHSTLAGARRWAAKKLAA